MKQLCVFFQRLTVLFACFVLKDCQSARWNSEDIFAGYEYSVGRYRARWGQARQKCLDSHADLASIPTREIDDFVHTLTSKAGKGDLWLGLYQASLVCNCQGVSASKCRRCRERWTWVDGTPMRRYMNWDISRYEPQTQRCGCLKKASGYWANRSCAARYHFVCARPLCTNYDCNGHGTCVADSDRQTCICDRGYRGDRCQSVCWPGPCPPEELEWRPENVFDGHEFAVSRVRLTWDDANTTCYYKNAKLAAITSHENNVFLQKFTTMRGRNMDVNDRWIGLHRPDSAARCSCTSTTQKSCDLCRESWAWLDGSQMEYMNWDDADGRKEPQRETCARFQLSGKWAEYYCSHKYRFICERPLCTDFNCNDNQNCMIRDETQICVCRPGLTGELCETGIDECASDPCMNGECLDQASGYMCNCTDGFTGYRCDEALCTESLCMNQGHCILRYGRHTCQCEPGYTGQRCESDIDECASDPCVNGECEDRVNGFECM